MICEIFVWHLVNFNNLWVWSYGSSFHKENLTIYKFVVDLLQKGEGHPNGIGALVSDCKAGLQEIPLVQITHCYCEVNKHTDILARRGAFLSQDFVVLLEPPMEVAFLLWLDTVGVSYEHLIPACMSGS